MKLIPLTKGQFSMVDDQDYEWLNKHKWQAFKNGKYEYYAKRSATPSEYVNGKRRNIWMHRVILKLDHDNPLFGDHENMNGLDNQRHNLRPATRGQNMSNKKGCGRSKYLGVNFNLVKSGDRKKTYDKWIVRIQHNGKRIHVGRYNTEEEAALAYNKKAIELHGEFARLNVIDKNASTKK